jgi:hypothetical protein
VTIAGHIATLLEMAATNNGFDRELRATDDWIAFASTQAPLQIWLRNQGPADYLVALSQLHVARALGDYGARATVALPSGAAAVRIVPSMPALHQLLRRAFQLSRTLPDELLHAFERETANLPHATEVERLVVQRVGQDLFRAGLFEYWEGRCAITGLAIPDLLRASHIKPWAICATDAERLDIYNGLLLAPHLDAAFDRGYITFADDGQIAISPALTASDRLVLALDSVARLRTLANGHRTYLTWHRTHHFRDAQLSE